MSQFGLANNNIIIPESIYNNIGHCIITTTLDNIKLSLLNTNNTIINIPINDIGNTQLGINASIIIERLL